MAIAGGVFAITANPILLALAAIFGTNVLAPLSFLAPGDRLSFRTVSLTRYGDLHRAMTGWTY
jgi:hypothetical protein